MESGSKLMTKKEQIKYQRSVKPSGNLGYPLISLFEVTTLHFNCIFPVSLGDSTCIKVKDLGDCSLDFLVLLHKLDN